MVKIFVIEDVKGILAAIVAVLQNAGYEVYPIWVTKSNSSSVISSQEWVDSLPNLLITVNFSEIISKFHEVQPNLILLDYFLFGSMSEPFSGDDVYQRIRGCQANFLSTSSTPPASWKFPRFQDKDDLRSNDEDMKLEAEQNLLSLVESFFS